LKKFGSVKNIREAEIDEISEIVGKKRAEIVREYFKNVNRK